MPASQKPSRPSIIPGHLERFLDAILRHEQLHTGDSSFHPNAHTDGESEYAGALERALLNAPPTIVSAISCLLEV